MKAREYDVLERAVEEGIRYGIRRFNKYVPEGPEGQAIEDGEAERLEGEVLSAVLNGICDWFDFERREPPDEAA